MATPEILETSAAHGQAINAESRRILAVLGGVIIFAGLVVFLAWNPSVRPGQQLDQPAASLRDASSGSWEVLKSEGDSRGPEFPPPMVRRSEQVCIGFGRVDFSVAERRPSLARCVPGVEVSLLTEGAMITLDIVTSGHDTWHFLEVGGDLRSFNVTQEGDDALASGRIYANGSTVALRLENNVELVLVEWSTIRGSFRCKPAGAAWSTSQFCS